MTTAPLSCPTRVSRIGLVLLSTALFVFATPAISGSRQSQSAHDAPLVSRLNFTGTFRFRPAPVVVRQTRSQTSGGSPITTAPQRTHIPPRATDQTRALTTTTKLKPSKALPTQQTNAQARPILLPAPRSSLGAPPKPDDKLTAASSPPATAATTGATRITQRTPKPRIIKPVKRKPSSICYELSPWAKNALFKPN